MSESDAPIRHEHIPVLAKEILQAFDRPAISLIVDGTLGYGGHSESLMEKFPSLRILGVEWDAQALASARRRLARFDDRFEAVEGSYADLPSILGDRGITAVDGLLLDLGLSSGQLADADRGFSFLRAGPLDMRMSRALPRTAWDILLHSDEDELARLFRTFGEEPNARPIAHGLKLWIDQGQAVNDAWQIAERIRRMTPRFRGGIDPATRCFQALRIAVNGELDNVDRILDVLPSILNPGGIAAIISFHSLEDRRVKNAFRAAAKGCICPPRVPQCVCGQKPWGKLVTRKAVRPDEEEMRENPRARSAKLRVLEKLA